MKMNATKLTIALVALLLALTCVFAACGKKNNTDKPDDTTPVDNNPTTVDTVAKEDLNAIAESLKAAYVANYVDLYAPATANEIEAAKSAALINIFAATSKEEAQKVADDFIAYLKSQKTIIDTVAALVEKIGDVSLKDADALNELADVVAKLDAAYAGTNAAKKTALDAYKADTATQKTIKAIVDRYDELKAAKKAADAKDGINDQIAELKADFTDADKDFALSDFNAYDALTKTIAELLEKYDIEIDSEAYESVIDAVALKAAKTALDTAFAKDPVLARLQALVDASATLTAAAEAAQWREYIYVDADKLDVKDEKETGATATYVKAINIDGETKYGEFDYELKDTKGTLTGTIKLPDGAVKYYDGTKFTAYATEDDAKDDDVKKIAKVEAKITIDYKLTLKDAVETAVKAKDNVFKFYSVAELTNDYGYAATAGNPIFDAKTNIETIETNYGKSVTAAKAAYTTAFIADTYTDVKLEKDSDYGTYKLNDELAKLSLKIVTKKTSVDQNQKNIVKAIDAATKNFASQTAAGNPIDGAKYYTKTGDYYADPSDNTDHGFYLVDGQPAIKYEAWNYTYQFGDKAIVTGTSSDPKDIESKVFDVVGMLATAYVPATNTSPALVQAKAALRWLNMYIGDGEYEDSYNLYEYKDYAGFAKTDVLYMTDRDITEVANPGVVTIRGNAVGVAKNEEALAAKVLSPYTMAKALVAEAEKVEEAKAAAREDLKAAALALRADGNVNAVVDAKKLLTSVEDGSYVNEKLGYELDLTATANATKKAYLIEYFINSDDTKIVLQTKPTKVPGSSKTVINDAFNAFKNAVAALMGAENQAKTADATYVTLKDLLDVYGVKLAGVTYTAGYGWDIDDNGSADYTVKSITTYADKQADLEEYSKLFADYVAEATRLDEVAQAGVAAFVVGEDEDDKNKGSNVTEKDLNRVKNIRQLFTSYEAFEYYYNTDNYLTDDQFITGTNAAGTVKIADLPNIGASTAVSPAVPHVLNLDKLLDPFKGATKTADHNALLKFIQDDLLVSIDDDPTDSSKKVIENASEFVAEYKAKAEEKFAELFEGYKGVKGLVASNAFDASAAITTAKNSIVSFGTTAFTDYVNLKVSIALGDEKLDYDFLTEVFRETLLANSQKVIDNVKAYAAILGKSAALTASDWANTVGARIDDMAVTFADVTSIQAADRAVNIANLNANDYSLGTAATAIGADVGTVKEKAFK